MFRCSGVSGFSGPKALGPELKNTFVESPVEGPRDPSLLGSAGEEGRGEGRGVRGRGEGGGEGEGGGGREGERGGTASKKKETMQEPRTLWYWRPHHGTSCPLAMPPSGSLVPLGRDAHAWTSCEAN